MEFQGAASGSKDLKRRQASMEPMPLDCRKGGKPKIVGVSGNLVRPSRTRTLVEAVLHEASARKLGDTALIDLVDAGHSLGHTFDRKTAGPALDTALEVIESADALVVGTAVYKGAYTGMFKHLFDLLHMNALARKPVLLTATGASPEHASVIDYHLRPLFLFFDAPIATRGLYGLQEDFEAPDRLASNFQSRVKAAVDELSALMHNDAATAGR